MRSETRTDGEIGIDDIGAGAADAPGIGALAAQRTDAATVWGTTNACPILDSLDLEDDE